MDRSEGMQSEVVEQAKGYPKTVAEEKFAEVLRGLVIESSDEMHHVGLAAINAYAATITGKNLSAKEVSDKCAEVYRNTVANLKKKQVDCG